MKQTSKLEAINQVSIMKRKNIAYFSNHFISNYGHGISRYSKNLFYALNKIEEKINIIPVSANKRKITVHELKNLKKKTKLELISYGRILTPILWKVFDRPKIENLIKFEPDIVHALSLSYPIATKKPLITTIHDIGPLSHPEYFTKKDQFFMNHGFEQVVKKASTIICVSNATANSAAYYSKKKFKIPIENKIKVIYEGIDNFCCDDNKFHFESKKLKKNRSNPYILFVGKLSPRKNLALILNSLDKIKHYIKDIKLIIVGGYGWNYKPTLKLINGMKQKHDIVFHNYVSDDNLKFLYQNAVAYINPSLFEGFGLTNLEAMACSCPVISSDIKSLNEISGNSALLINPKDENALCNAVVSLYNDNNMRKEYVNKGLERIKKFSWIKTSKETFNVYLNNL